MGGGVCVGLQVGFGLQDLDMGIWGQNENLLSLPPSSDERVRRAPAKVIGMMLGSRMGSSPSSV